VSPRTRRAALLLALAVAVVGCGSAAGPAGPASAPVSPVSPPSLATSMATDSGTWAVAVMGGSAADHDDFWQLFVRPAGSGKWRLVTPPGVASNGGLVVASPGAGSAVAGFRPSQGLTYSPLAATSDNGTAWAPGLLDAGLANVPDSLAAGPADGRLLALLANGTVEISGSHGIGWATLTSQHSLAGTTAGKECKLDHLMAAAFSPAGIPMVAAACAHAGTAGIFAYAGGAWHHAGPVLPAAYAHEAITVLRLTTVTGATMALLAAGSGSAAQLLAAKSTDSGAHWALSPALSLRAAPKSASFGTGGTAAVTLPGNHADTLTAIAGGWQPLPTLPAGTVTLAQALTAGWDALAVHGATLTVWRLTPGARAWSITQTIKVPIELGSSN
jgi:hypothetical protein